MVQQNRVHDEHMFHRLEMRCREIAWTGNLTEAETWTANLSRTFGWAADYGWSIARPAVGLLLVLAAGWALIFVAEWWDYNLGEWPDPDRPAEYLGFWQSGALSLSNVLGFLGLNRTFLAEEIRTLTPFSEIVSVAQTVAGLVLLFLFGLALRNRFRIK